MDEKLSIEQVSPVCRVRERKLKLPVQAQPHVDYENENDHENENDYENEYCF